MARKFQAKITWPGIDKEFMATITVYESGKAAVFNEEGRYCGQINAATVKRLEEASTMTIQNNDARFAYHMHLDYITENVELLSKWLEKNNNRSDVHWGHVAEMKRISDMLDEIMEHVDIDPDEE